MANTFSPSMASESSTWKICRTCLAKEWPNLMRMDTELFAEYPRSVHEMFIKCYPQAQKEVQPYHYVCLSCVNTVNNIYKFSTKFETATKVFNRLNAKLCDANVGYKSAPKKPIDQMVCALMRNLDELIKSINSRTSDTIIKTERENENGEIDHLFEQSVANNNGELSENNTNYEEAAVNNSFSDEDNLPLMHFISNEQRDNGPVSVTNPVPVPGQESTKSGMKKRVKILVKNLGNFTQTSLNTINTGKENELAVDQGTIIQPDNESEDLSELNTDEVYDNEVIESMESPKTPKTLETPTNEGTFDIIEVEASRELNDNELQSLNIPEKELKAPSKITTRKSNRLKKSRKDSNDPSISIRSDNGLIPIHESPNQIKPKQVSPTNQLENPENPHICSFCNKTFKLNKNLANHMRHTHPNEIPYTCNTCDTKFVTSHNLTNHKLRKHSEPVTCSQCNKTFKSNYLLERHTKLVHTDERSHVCDSCGKGFKNRKNLRRHQTCHMAVNPHTCDICHKGSTSAANLQAHMLVHSNKRAFVCPICGKQFKTAAHLRDHERIHTDVKPFPCDVCGKSYRRARVLRTHKLSHSDARPYVCDTCDKTFYHSWHLKEHKLCHTAQDQKPSHTCDKCGKGFLTAQRLRVHLRRVHMGMRTNQRYFSAINTHVCDVCGQGFSEAYRLRQHAITHVDVRAHACTMCDKRYKEERRLKQHMRLHSVDNPHVCSICKKGFIIASQLANHMICRHTKGGGRFKCDMCDKTFAQRGYLNKHHKRQHSEEGAIRSFKCIVAQCGKAFYDAYKLKQHVLCVHTEEKPHVCDVCHKGFSLMHNLAVHKRLHSGQKPYSCGMCAKTFTSSGNCRKHERECRNRGKKITKRDKLDP